MAAKKSTTKAAPAKKSSAKKTTTTSVQSSHAAHEDTTHEAKNPGMKIKKPYIVAAVVIVLLGVLLYTYRGLFIVATVNGVPISRITVVRELERQGGKQIVNDMVVRELIEQEAKRKGIVLTQKELDADIAKMEEEYKSKGQTLDQVLKMYGITREEVAQRRRPSLLLEKLLGEPVKISDKEVEEFITKNNEAYGGTLTADQVRKDLQAERMQQKQQELIQRLQKDAKVVFNVTY